MHVLWLASIAARVLHARHATPRLRAAHDVPQRATDVGLFRRHFDVYFIHGLALAHVVRDARDDVDVDVRHRLAGLGPVLHGDGEAAAVLGAVRLEVDAAQHALHALHRREQVRRLRRGEVGEAPVRLQRADEDVPGEDRLEVHDAKAVLRFQKHLRAICISMKLLL